MELNGKRVLVIGLGRTGVATTWFLLDKGARVMIADEKSVSELGNAVEAFARHADVELGIRHDDMEILSRTDMIVPSPGVPPFNCLLARGMKMGIPIISEMELAFGYLKKPAIAITGTNGKTTTTSLLARILEHCGKKVFMGGNIGNPLISYVNGRQEADLVVIEVSSFQLQWVRNFHPFIAVLLNMSSDHLDYHGSLEEYQSIKERIFACQGEGDFAILNADDPVSTDLSKRLTAEYVLYFSSTSRLKDGMFIDGESLRYRSGELDEAYPIGSIKLNGVHNLENVMAAVLASRMYGCSSGEIIDVLGTFSGISHRLEFVGIVDGVEYYNDSKGTNVDAVRRALESFPGPVVLLVGGRYKSGDFGILAKLIEEKVRMLIVFGEAGEKIKSIIGGITRTETASNLKDAVRMAHDNSTFGDIVLLSPGCSSFDEFNNYKERGIAFNDMIDRMGSKEDQGIWTDSLP